MDKEERIKKYGEAAYEKHLQQRRDLHEAHREDERDASRGWYWVKVEKNQHMHGIIDVIKIIDGEITLLTEKEFGEASKRGI